MGNLFSSSIPRWANWRRRSCAIATTLIVYSQALFPTPAFAAETIRLSASLTPLSLPIYVADDQGYFAAEGLTLKINDVIGGHRALHQLFDGNADLVTSSEAVIMFNSFQRSDYAVIATFVSSDDDVRAIVGEGGGISQAKQLAGKSVGTVVGSAGHYYLDTLLLLNGVDPKSIQVRNLQPEAMAGALRRGEVDAVVIWELIAFKILDSVPGAKVLPKSGAYKLTFNLVINKKTQGVHDEELVKLLRALDRAEKFIQSNPAIAQKILRERLEVDQAFIDSIWPRYQFRLTLNQSLIATLEGEARWARQERHVKAGHSPNYLDFIYSSPLRRVRMSVVNIIE